MSINDCVAAGHSAPGAHDHLGCINHALGVAERLCTDRGARFTPLRRLILELVWESHRPVKAYDLMERVRPLGTTAKPATVYRALEFLLEQGFIHRVESLNAFIGCVCSGQQHEQVLLICRQCEQVEERPAERVLSALAGETEAAGFIPIYKSIEVHGVCAACASKQ
jgi:Fur family zinc uptake transcriptional regulator